MYWTEQCMDWGPQRMDVPNGPMSLVHHEAGRYRVVAYQMNDVWWREKGNLFVGRESRDGIYFVWTELSDEEAAMILFEVAR